MRCVGAVIVVDGCLLLIRRGQQPGLGLWSLPGGRVEPGETDAEAVVREVAEETALTVAAGPHVGSVTLGPYDVHDYRATVLAGTIRAGTDAADVRWVPLDAVAALATTTGLVSSLRSWRVLPG